MKIFSYKNPKIKEKYMNQRIQIFMISCISILALIASIWNAIDLTNMLNTTTKEYLSDVTKQISSDISGTIEGRMSGLATVADSMSNIESPHQKEIVDFLNRKAKILEFDTLVFMDKEGNYISSEIEDEEIVINAKELISMSSVQEAFHNEVTTNDLKGKYIYYCMPVYTHNEITHVLIGMRTQAVMQSMISSKVFDGQGLSCIIDSQGKLVLSPTEISPFMQLEDILSQDNEQFIEDIDEMNSHMQEGKNGIIEFRSVNDEDLFLSYNSLKINDWYLLTLIPSDLISSNISTYAFQSYLIVVSTSIIFIGLLLILHRINRNNNKQLAQIAFIDDITGGMNNSAFQLNYQKLSGSFEPLTYTIVLLDIKGFKLINEQYGIQQANEFLKYVYNQIKNHLHHENNEFLARSESDHFFICMKENDANMIQKRIDEMIDDINSFHNIEGTYYQISLKQGAYLIENPQEDITILQDRARIAMQNRCTDMQNQCSFYDSSLIEKLKKDNEIYALFDDSLKHHDFEVYLQPKVGLKSMMVEGAEALIRWNHPKKGFIYPSDFIPLFERGGQICQLDLYVFEEVCRLIDRWSQEGQSLILISVNISREHFQNDSFFDEYVNIAKKYKIPKNTIEFELTESLFFERNEIQKVKKIIKQMHELGFQCSLDDFGFGYSSLALLNEFDVDTFKFDQSFFVNMDNQKSKDIIVTLIQLAQKLHVNTVAEGIENKEQLHYLKSIGCDQIQGYIFSKPLPIDAFEEWVKTFHCL